MNNREEVDTKINWIITILIIILLLLFFIRFYNLLEANKGADIALYSGEGTWEDSVTAAKNMFKWMGYSVSLIDDNYINKNDLDNFKILCIPGGNMYTYAQDISSKGRQNIKEFILNGGGYIGICGGAYYASNKVIWNNRVLSMTPLKIFSGKAAGPIDDIAPYPEYKMCELDIMNSSEDIIGENPDSAWMLYYWGPSLIPDEGEEVTVLGRYSVRNQIAILCFEYSLGRVFLIGTHPEIEEDSDRDGVDFDGKFDDRGSDWDLMRNAVIWCLNEQEK